MDALLYPSIRPASRTLPVVGGKNASLGEMFNRLSPKKIRVPDGFATTAAAFWQFIGENKLRESLQFLIKKQDWLISQTLRNRQRSH